MHRTLPFNKETTMAYKKIWKSKRWMQIDLIATALLVLAFFVTPIVRRKKKKNR